MIAILFYALVAAANIAFAVVNGHWFNWLVAGFALGLLSATLIEKFFHD